MTIIDKIWDKIRTIIDKIRSILSKGKAQNGKESAMNNPHPFEKININDKAKELNLISKGRKDAKNGQPPSDSTDFSSTEIEIQGTIGHEQTAADEEYKKRIGLYESDLSDLKPIGEQVNKMRTAISTQETKFDQLAPDINEVGSKRNDFRHEIAEFDEFKGKNNLDRPAHSYDTPKKVLWMGIIAVLFLIETMGNTSFLAKGNELGILGAYAEAIFISFVNLGVAFLLGMLAKNAFHNSKGRKCVGFLVLILFIIFATFFNLMVAHYREITGTALDEGGQLAIAAFVENPWGLKDFQSWILFFMGFLFAIISFIDGLFWDDIYPQYGKRHHSFEKKKEEYEKKYEKVKNELQDENKNANKVLEKISQDIVDVPKKYYWTVDAYSRLIKSYKDHLDHLEDAGNSLLNVYQTANREWRKQNNPAPERFKERWKMDKTIDEESVPERLLQSEEDIKNFREAATDEYNKGKGVLNDKYQKKRSELENVAPN